MIVAPFAGAWIEIPKIMNSILVADRSLPSRERGLKFRVGIYAVYIFAVAPFAGAWIEIWFPPFRDLTGHVAPFAGAWIEIIYKGFCEFVSVVAPFAGAWIEIKMHLTKRSQCHCRSLRGSVD